MKWIDGLKEFNKTKNIKIGLYQGKTRTHINSDGND